MGDARTLGWQADLHTLISAREAAHPDPWFGISRSEYVAAVESVVARIPELDEDQMLVETTRLAAMPTWNGRDGHGGIFPWIETTNGLHAYPLRLYWFSDGLFVVDALPPYEDLIGSRVDDIAGHPLDRVVHAASPLLPRDNDMNLLSLSPRLIVVPEILRGLGLIDSATAPASFTVTGAEGASDVAIEPITLGSFRSWNAGVRVLSPPPRSGGPLWLENLESACWWEVIPGTSTAYVGFNQVDANSVSTATQLSTALDEGAFDRLIVDLRHNGGGDNTTYHALLSVVQRAAEELPGGVYMLIGRVTFSAAGNFSTEVERTTDAVFVGEDLGASPNLYGDTVTTTLGHSGLSFRVAARYWEKSTADDQRITIEPDLEVLLSSADYFGDVDPVLDAVLSE
ncbi:MAG TPA: hypothetical protein VEX62_03380 [Candidatus Limnocylindrales bacterium]|nr:hypothetical protein [Candidatus Limnocylindrales bacterium]